MEKLSAKSYQPKALRIGIDASRAFLKQRTGIEEYSYQVIRHLRTALPETVAVVLYMRPDQTIDFSLPAHWRVRRLAAPRLWTQARLSFELWQHPVDTLFIPAHTIPLIHPRRSVVTIHGLEYEESPQAYSFWERLYMRLSIRFSTGVAWRIIAVSENTKRDLLRLYGVREEKVRVVYEGVDIDQRSNPKDPELRIQHKHKIPDGPFFLFIGRLEERKNVRGIIEAFELFKKKTDWSHTLVLVGKPGFGYEKIKHQISKSKYQASIIELGYISHEEKKELLNRASVFLFPSLYEGFGIPVLEAQAAGVPVITSKTSSLPEVSGEGAILVSPKDTRAMADALENLVSNEALRADILEKGKRNVLRFSWAKCAEDIAPILLSEKKEV